MKTRHQRRRSGQTIIFALLVLVIALFIGLWLFDAFKTTFVKSRSRNGGDGAALAAARWQALTLNLIGDLNVLQAVALAQALAQGDDTFAEARAIADLQARLNLAGPTIGLLAAQQAAKNNGLDNNSDYTARLAEHAEEIRATYGERFPDPPYHNDPEPPTAWDDYAGMIAAVASLGIAAWPDNMRLYADYANDDHLLLNPAFYDAVASADWCWFFFNAHATLQSYQSWHDWAPLPWIEEPTPINAEAFGLGLRRVTYLSMLEVPEPAANAVTAGDIQEAIESFAGFALGTSIVEVAATWYAYRDDLWKDWTELMPENFPFRNPIRAQYNYAGADAAVRLEASADRLTPGVQTDVITWSAAAKPFGHLEGSVRPDHYGLVLPAFQETRLIPIDASSAPATGSRPGWWQHVYYHVRDYAARGLDALVPGCWYCGALRRWEVNEFRQAGIDWLEENSASCVQPGGGGPGGGGRRGH